MHIQNLSVCIVILIILAFLWHSSSPTTEPFRVFTKCEEDHRVMTSEEITLAYELIYQITTAFDLYNIKYFMIGGTLLGSMRHGGLMDWDDDMDIGVLDEDTYKVKAAMEYLAYTHDIMFTDETFGSLMVFYTHHNNFPFVDVFYYTRQKDKYILLSEDYQKQWPNEWFHESELFPLQKGKFGELHLSSPFVCIPYMERTFGTMWNTEFKGIKNHKHGVDAPAVMEGKLTKEMLCYH